MFALLPCAQCSPLPSVEKFDKAEFFAQPLASPLTPGVTGAGGFQCAGVGPGRLLLMMSGTRGKVSGRATLMCPFLQVPLTAGQGLLLCGLWASCRLWAPTPGAGPQTGVCVSVVAGWQAPGKG